MQYIQCRTKGQFKEDNPLKLSADPTCGTVFIPLWTVWKGSLELWIERTAGQRPSHYHRPDRQRGVSSHTATLLSTEISFMQPDNTFMQVKMPQRPLCLIIFSIVCSCWRRTDWRICRLMQSSSVCVEVVLKGVFMSVPSPFEVLRKPQAHWKTDCENLEHLTLRRLLLQMQSSLLSYLLITCSNIRVTFRI